MPPTLRLGGAYVSAAYRHRGVTRCEHDREPGRIRGGGCERGLILGFGLWRGLMLDRLPVLGQPAPHPGHQLHRVRRPLLRSHLVQPVLEGPAEVDLLSFLSPSKFITSLTRDYAVGIPSTGNSFLYSSPR